MWWVDLPVVGRDHLVEHAEDDSCDREMSRPILGDVDLLGRGVFLAGNVDREGLGDRGQELTGRFVGGVRLRMGQERILVMMDRMLWEVVVDGEGRGDI